MLLERRHTVFKHYPTFGGEIDNGSLLHPVAVPRKSFGDVVAPVENKESFAAFGLANDGRQAAAAEHAFH